jgi:hypothetical protein
VEEKASACSVRNDGGAGTMFRLLPGIFDIVPLQGDKERAT